MDDRDSGYENLAGTCPCPLKLFTMAGKEIEVIVPVNIHHHWEMLEDYLVELLAKGFGFDTFGCELKLVAEDTLSPLRDPIHEALWDPRLPVKNPFWYALGKVSVTWINATCAMIGPKTHATGTCLQLNYTCNGGTP